MIFTYSVYCYFKVLHQYVLHQNNHCAEVSMSLFEGLYFVWKMFFSNQLCVCHSHNPRACTSWCYCGWFDFISGSGFTRWLDINVILPCILFRTVTLSHIHLNQDRTCFALGSKLLNIVNIVTGWIESHPDFTCIFLLELSSKMARAFMDYLCVNIMPDLDTLNSFGRMSPIQHIQQSYFLNYQSTMLIQCAAIFRVESFSEPLMTSPCHAILCNDAKCYSLGVQSY